MARKRRSFLAKLAHDRERKEIETCSICGKRIKHIRLHRNISKNGFAPKSQMVKVCDCNEKEILG